MMAILHAVAGKACIAGFILTEFVPERDDRYKLSYAWRRELSPVALGLIARKPCHATG